jgi:glycosyltransferase involved in cell wall biosynthesis
LSKLRVASIFSSRVRQRGRVRTPASAAGDRARDRGDYQEAAAKYRLHLLLAPGDVAIWVQLGHALKEDGHTPDAIAAYQEASVISPDDADIRLHLGHCYKLVGDMASAIPHLRRSVAIDGNPHALAELERIGVPAETARPLATDRQRQALLRAIGQRSVGLTPTASSDVSLESGNVLRFASSDPWIEFTFNPDIDRHGPIGLLEIEASSIDDSHKLASQLYIDRGAGFDEQHSARFFMPAGRTAIIMLDPGSVQRLRWDPDRGESEIGMPRISFRLVTDPDDLTRLVRDNAPNAADADRLIAPFLDVLDGSSTDVDERRHLPALICFGFDFSHDYNYFVLRNETLSNEDRRSIERIDKAFAYRPRFSFVMPTYNTPAQLLAECLDSLLAQTYRDFEICIADDNSPNPDVVDILDNYARRDTRVKYVKRAFNGHISAASNSALAIASGDFVVLVDHDDLIPDYALFVAAWYLNKTPDADILYSDEDKVMPSGQRLQPYFKSDFNKFLMYGHNMISHLGIYRRSLVEKVGGFRLGLEGSQDYDLFLRCYEQSSDEKVAHIPHVLYHWRIIPGSTAMSADQKSYAVVAAELSINGHFERCGMPLRSGTGFAPGCTSVRPSKTLDTPTTIIIPTRNGIEVLRPCIDSILERAHDAVEIIVVDNGSDDVDALRYLDRIETDEIAKVLRYPGPFNFSLINNFAAEHASGEVLCFLNNDTEIVSADWLNRARVFLSVPEIGAVGGRLLYPDGTLQHFGLALGMGDHKVAGTPHGGMDGDASGYFGKARLLQEVSAVTAACLFIRKSDFLAAGGFEPELRVAYNDVDLCLKIRAMGLKILVDPDITLIHKESRTRGSDKQGARSIRLDEEARWMRTRWSAQLDHDPYFSPNLDLGRVDFAFAPEPRVAWPWRQLAETDRAPRSADAMD